MIHNSVLIITGPTASGKTDLAISLAKKFGGELISADSRQVYKFLDIGTAKDKSFPHHMIDMVDPRTQVMSAADYQRQVYKIINGLHNQNILPIIVGGSGLYINAVIKGYEFPKGKTKRGEFNERFNPPPYKFLIIGIEWPREKLYELIDQRVDDRIKQGMVEEVQNLRKIGLTDQRIDSFGLEYRYVLKYVLGLLSKDQMTSGLKSAIHSFVRHQYNWFKRWPVIWLNPSELKRVQDLVADFINQ